MEMAEKIRNIDNEYECKMKELQEFRMKMTNILSVDSCESSESVN